MAKSALKNAKTGKKAKKKTKPERFEAAGWGFWLICFAVLFGPCWYLGHRYSYSETQGGLFPWVVGFALAAFGAGLLSVVVNYGLHKRMELKHKRARKKRK